MYTPERQKGVTYSAVMHLIGLLLAIFGLPAILNNKPPEEPSVISVEILPISTVTNVKPAEAPAQQPKPEEKKPPEQKKPAPPVKTAENTPPPPQTEKPVPVPKPVEKKEDKKPEKKEDKNKAKPEDLDAVLRAVRDTAQKESKDNSKNKPTDTSKNKNNSHNFNESLPMSMSEKDAIVSQISNCWNPPVGAKNAQDLAILLEIEVSQDGSVTKVELANEAKGRYSQDSFFRAAADSAIRAVRQCSPLKNLPPEKFGTWHSMELNFDPKDML